MPKPSIQLLGGLRVSLDGKPARGLYERARALLAYICDGAERAIPREGLTELLWPDEPLPIAKRNLRQALSRLRSVFADADEPLILTSRGTVQLNPRRAAAVDLHELWAAPMQADSEHPDPATLPWLEAAAAAYRGPFLDGFYLADNDAFERWLVSRRETHKQRALTCLRLLARHYEGVGEFGRACQWLRRELGIEPWLEDAHRRLMYLLARNGQRTAALAQFNTCRGLLWEELGVEPEAATLSLRDRIAREEPITASLTPELPVNRAERRHVIALCCASEPVPAVDPEQLIDIEQSLSERCRELAHELQAHYASDGNSLHWLLFGFPKAHEDDAERAVLAASRLLGGLSAGPAAPGLRIGMDSGLAVTPEGEDRLIGAPLTMAARLRFQAAAGQALLSPELASRVPDCFELEAGPEGAARLCLPCAESTPTVKRPREQAKTGFGRNQELRRLNRLWQSAVRGCGQCAIVSGTSGLGKSTLINLFCRHLAAKGPLIYRLQCEPQYKASALRPVRALLERLCEFSPTADPADKAARLRRTLLQLEMPAQAYTPLAALLELAKESPTEAAQQPAELVTELLLRHSGQRPALWILEDMHWADPSTLTLVRHMLGRLSQAPLLMVLTGRDAHELAAELPGPLELLQLKPLGMADSRRLARAVAGPRPLAKDLLERIIHRAEGVPLFVEALTEAALESAGRTRDAGPALLPATLQDSLMARIDALGSSKPLAQLAAVIGREFSLSTLQAVDDRTAAQVEADLIQLLRAGVARNLSNGGRRRFAFSHALLQEAAYQSLLYRQRRTLHGCIAEVLSSQESAPPELLAQHWTAAQAWATAVDCWLQAGDQAQRLGAHAEALQHCRHGLALLPKLAPSPERDRRELALQLGCGMPVMFLHGPVPEMEQAYERALAISRDMPATDDLYPPLRGLYTYYLGNGQLRRAKALAECLLQIARGQSEDALIMDAYRTLGAVMLLKGELEAGSRRLEHVLLLDEASTLADTRALDVHPAPIARALLAVTAALAALPNEGRTLALAAVAEARTLKHPNTLGITLNLAASALEIGGLHEQSAELAEELLALTARRPMPVWNCWSKIMSALAQARQQADTAALAALLPLFQQYDQIGPEMGRPYSSCLWADTLLRCGQIEAGLSQLASSLNRARRQEAWLHVPELLRLQGELLIAKGATVEGQRRLRQALRLSRRIGTEVYARRACSGLERLRQESGPERTAAYASPS